MDQTERPAEEMDPRGTTHVPRVRDLISTRNLTTLGPKDDLGLAMQAMSGAAFATSPSLPEVASSAC